MNSPAIHQKLDCRQNYTENTEAEVCSFTIILVLLQSTPIIIYHIVHGRERMNKIYSDKEGQALIFVQRQTKEPTLCNLSKHTLTPTDYQLLDRGLTTSLLPPTELQCTTLQSFCPTQHPTLCNLSKHTMTPTALSLSTTPSGKKVW